MSALTDFFTSLSNKVRSLLGTSRTYTPAEAVSAIDDVYNKAVTDTKKGNAEAAHVLSPKTFTSLSAGVNKTGTMPDKGAWTSTENKCNATTVKDVAIPEGYHNGSGYVRFNSLSSQTSVDSGKTAIVASAIKSGYQGWVNGQKITGTLELSGNAGTNHVLSGKTFYSNSFTKQTGTITNKGSTGYSLTPANTSTTIAAGHYDGSGKITISSGVDSGKKAITAGSVLAGYQGWVNGTKITGNVSTRSNGTTANATGIDSTGPYVYFPYGYYAQAHSTYGSYVRLTTVQAKNVHKHTETWTPSGNNLNSSGADMSEIHSYRKVNTNVCYTAGYNSGANTGYMRNQYYGKKDWSGTATSHSFTYSGLKTNGRYFYVIMAQQTGGAYSGVGSGAKSYPSGSGITSDEAQGWGIEQVSCQSDNTSGLGGMVMRSFGAFQTGSSATSVTINLSLINNITGFWCVYLWGSY